jgi:hypothetical protein
MFEPGKFATTKALAASVQTMTAPLLCHDLVSIPAIF